MSEMDEDADDSGPSREHSARRHSTGTSTTTRHTTSSPEPPSHGPTQAVRPDGRLHEHLERDDWRAEATSGVVHHETCVCNPCRKFVRHIMDHMWSGDHSLVRAMAARDAAIIKHADLGNKVTGLERDLEDARHDNDDLTDANERLRDEADGLRDDNDRAHAVAGELREETARLQREVADLRSDVNHLRGKLHDAEDDMHRERRRKVSPPAPPTPVIPLVDRMPKLPLVDRMAPTSGRTLLTPGADGAMRHTYLPAHVLRSDQAQFNIAAGLPPPLGLTPVGGRDGYLSDSDPSTIGQVNSLFARARAAPNSPAAAKAKYFMERVSLTPLDRHSPVHKHAIALWATTAIADLAHSAVVEHAPMMPTAAAQPGPSSTKPARPRTQDSPMTWRQWLVTHPDARHLRQHTRGVGTSDDFPIRNVRGYVAALRLAPPRGKARSTYMLRAAAILGVPQAYREALEETGETIAHERHDTPMGVDYDPSHHEVVAHFARNGLTLAEADDYWAWGQEFISTYVSDIQPSPNHPARIAYNAMNSTPHLPPTLEGFPDDHETSFAPAYPALESAADGLELYPAGDQPSPPGDAPSPRF
ncbi:hypothetical protein FA95DRAFT_1569672 [Auriscalpium vulgare]|uniref:Uncharacterized protein n=1 Tax=Auriscalpium vulgare TaxID=40419 RepID=A0ACB8S6R3_9AGAM|nr:hypothetical protein FA95DRAFT_1569672 [Auriscalpium vulgare]